MERPTGVTVLAILAFVAAGFLVLSGFLLFVGGAMMSRLAVGPGLGNMAGLGSAIVAVIFLGFAALYLMIGLGFLKLQNWARVLAIVLAALGLIVNGFAILGPLVHFHPIFLLWRAAILGIDVWVLVYLFQPHVKQAFGATSL